jgi:UDPglucose--hexose-1-phosphate uridylyltransferase
MVKDFADALKTCLRGMRSLLNNPPYNYGFHIAPHADMEEYYHWHLEVYPKLTVWAGFEKNTGVYINVVPPEDAAHNLKQVIQQQ